MVKRSNGSKHEEYKPMKTIHLRNRYTICSMGIICLFLCVTYYLPTSVYLSSIQLQIKTTNLFGYRSLSQMDCGSQYESVKNEACSGVLSCMTSGTWKTRELTSQERTEIDTFLKGSRDVIPNNTDYQRPDLKCGNLPYAETNPRVWFRVLCNPGGPTPCCFNNRCDNKTVDECRGPMNFDLRPRVHAEYSKWQPTDKKCSVKIFDSESACNLLKGSTIYVIGDSLMRQLYTALLMIIRGDLKTGALLPNTPEAMRKLCSGMYIFPHKACRTFIDFQPTVCNGSLKLKFKHYPSTMSSLLLLYDVIQLKGKRKSMVFLGVGIWDLYNEFRVINTYLAPTLQALVNPNNRSYIGWPRVLWSAVHSLGIWRYPYVKTVDNVHGKQFNDNMAAYLRNFNIPIFDTFNITDGVMSIDGTHYGIGVNMLKAQMYLNYMQELENKGLW